MEDIIVPSLLLVGLLIKHWLDDIGYKYSSQAQIIGLILSIGYRSKGDGSLI